MAPHRADVIPLVGYEGEVESRVLGRRRQRAAPAREPPEGLERRVPQVLERPLRPRLARELKVKLAKANTFRGSKARELVELGLHSALRALPVVEPLARQGGVVLVQELVQAEDPTRAEQRVQVVKVVEEEQRVAEVGRDEDQDGGKVLALHLEHFPVVERDLEPGLAEGPNRAEPHDRAVAVEQRHP